jgi:glycosyltransferase involved in cell wall biosynthesis
VIAADERDLEQLGGPSERQHLVPIGSNVRCSPPPDYDREAFRLRLGLEPTTLVVAYFGLLNASKGLDLLVDVFERVVRGRPDARLMLLGGEVGASDPTDRQTAARLRQRLASAGGRVIQTGWLAETELSAYLLAADVALLPYADGASPRRGSLLACAEHGLPIVSTLPASTTIADAIHPVEPVAESLAAAVLEVADNPSLCARLREASRCLADRVSWPPIADAHIAIYSGLGAAEKTHHP